MRQRVHPRYSDMASSSILEGHEIKALCRQEPATNTLEAVFTTNEPGRNAATEGQEGGGME